MKTVPIAGAALALLVPVVAHAAPDRRKDAATAGMPGAARPVPNT